jgi:hypothetical protein
MMAEGEGFEPPSALITSSSVVIVTYRAFARLVRRDESTMPTYGGHGDSKEIAKQSGRAKASKIRRPSAC